METPRHSYAYQIFIADYRVASQYDWSDWSTSGFFGFMMDVEGTDSTTPEMLADIHVEEGLYRITPIQITRDWNPREYLEALFEKCGTPFEAGVVGRFEEDDLLYCSCLPEEDALSVALANTPSTVFEPDRLRFEAILSASCEMANARNQGIIFLGAWGGAGSYEHGVSALSHMESIYRAAGMRFFSRTAPVDAVREDTSPEPVLTAQEMVAKHEGEAQEQCLGHLKLIFAATVMHWMDNDDILPDAVRWWEQITLYLGEEAPLLTCPTSSLPFAYAMNANLSGVDINAVQEQERTVLFYESTTGVIHAHDTGESLPNPPRHLGGTWIVFADGTPRIVQPEEYSELKWTVD
jgi:hypothetical protein